jgi:hypothetical protein
MSTSTQIRIAGMFISVLIGVSIPLFLLGPVIFHSLPLNSIGSLALSASIGSIIFGIWLLVVSYFALPKDLENVITMFQAGDGVILLLPYMLLIGSKSILCRLRKYR